jgi:isoprenylcysteine carboxyl methyltransferase (ICMT) family protein YpbQ
MAIAYAILALVVLQRVGELIYASRNTRALKLRGGIES